MNILFSTIFLFASLSELLEAENLFLGEGYKYQIEPVPTHIASECGMCIATNETDAEVMAALLTGQAIPFQMLPKEN